MLINYDEIERLVGRAAAYYEKLAPTVTAHLEDLALRLAERPEQVSLYEVTQVGMLWECGQWEGANFASNRIYKLRDLLGMDTTGALGF